MNKNGIKVEGHRGTWYVISEMDVYNLTTKKKDFRIYLLEHEHYGDEVPHLIVTGDLKILVDDVHNGFDDYWEFFNRNEHPNE